MRLHFASVAALLLTGTASAQTVRISGTVVEEGRSTPIRGVTIRITGSDTTMTTGPSGTFSLSGLLPGQLILTASLYGYELRTLRVDVNADTVITVIMRPRVETLAPMIVRPGGVRIKGSVVDSVTGEYLWFTLVGLHPEGRYVDASGGDFKVDKVAPGPVTIVIEAAEHLPKQVQFNAMRDTTIRILMAVDSVALRMIKVQVERITNRVEAFPYPLRGYNRDLIARERVSNVGELIDRLTMQPERRQIRDTMSADEHCYFLDDRKIAPGVLNGLLPELIERIELLHQGRMIRVYSKRYVRTLIGKKVIPKVTYLPIGLRTTCD